MGQLSDVLLAGHAACLFSLKHKALTPNFMSLKSRLHVLIHF